MADQTGLESSGRGAAGFRAELGRAVRKSRAASTGASQPRHRPGAFQARLVGHATEAERVSRMTDSPAARSAEPENRSSATRLGRSPPPRAQVTGCVDGASSRRLLHRPSDRIHVSLLPPLFAARREPIRRNW